jgi:hypothetical protein
VLRAEEGRGKLRKASGSRTQALIRGYPNGGTRRGEASPPVVEAIGDGGQSTGTETSQYREGKKSSEMPLVVASERGGAQTACMEKPAGVVGAGLRGFHGRSGRSAAACTGLVERHGKAGQRG